MTDAMGTTTERIRFWVEKLGVFVALVIALFAFRGLVSRWSEPLGIYDEALVFVDARLMNSGKAIYRDFYANYPPGSLQVARLVMALGLPPIWTVRLISLLLRVGGALLAGRIVARAGGKPGIDPWIVATTLVIVEPLGLGLYAYSVGVFVALLIIATWPVPGAPLWRRIASGVLLGIFSYVRHDLFVYISLFTLIGESASWALRKRSFFFGSARELAQTAAVVAITVLTLWLPIFAASGISQFAHDAALDQARFVQRARVLPIPSMIEPINLPLPFKLPLSFLRRTQFCVVLIFASTIAAIVAMALRLHAERSMPRDVQTSQTTLYLGVVMLFAFAILPQSFQRTDLTHAGFGIPITLAALFIATGSRLKAPVLLLAIAPWAVELPKFASAADVQRMISHRDDTTFMTPDRRAVRDFVLRETAENEPIFVGCTSHSRALISFLDTYHWAARPGATRYMQFDPGLVTSEWAQREMIDDLERAKPRLVLREPGCTQDEPNASREEGSGVLDAYLSTHYTQYDVVSGVAMWRRNDTAAAR